MERDIKKFRKITRTVCVILFFIYVIVILYLLLISDAYGRVQMSYYRYNLKPFQEIGRFLTMIAENNKPMVALVNLCGNILAFVPYGLLIRGVLNRNARWWAVIGTGAAFSLIIELIQLVTRIGSFDVDDIILNTLGAALGFGIYRILRAIVRRKHTGGKDESKSETRS